MRGLFLPDSSRGKYESNNANSRTLREHGQGLGWKEEEVGAWKYSFVRHLREGSEQLITGKSFM